MEKSKPETDEFYRDLTQAADVIDGLMPQEAATTGAQEIASKFKLQRELDAVTRMYRTVEPYWDEMTNDWTTR